MAIEDHIGMSLAELARKYVFKPLGMQNTTMKQHGERGFLTNVAKVHDRNGKLIGTGIPICPQIAPSGMWSTPTDMAKFMIETQQALRGDKTKVISQRVAKRVTAIVTTKLIGGHGLGWNRVDSYGNREWFSHGGSNTGTGGYVLGTMKGGNGVAVFGNSHSSLLFSAILPFQSSIIESHQWARSLSYKNKKAKKDFLRKISGSYVAVPGVVANPFSEESTTQIAVKNNKLLATSIVPFKDVAELVQIAENTFAIEEYNSKIRFVTNPENGKLYLTIARNGLENNVEYAYEKLPDGKELPDKYLLAGDYKNALEGYKAFKEQYGMNVENTINNLGYGQIGKKNYKIAIYAFRLNVELHPESANVYDSLGEAYMLSGEKDLAIINYQKSLELDPKNDNARKMLKKLGGI